MLALVLSGQFLDHINQGDKSCLSNSLGEAYAFQNAQTFTDPQDVFKLFSDAPEGFHLKECSYGELLNLLKLNYSSNFSSW